MKDHIEGGKAFLNRCDDMFVIHRLVKHESMKYVTLLSVEKVKDTDTGGQISGIDEFVMCDFNSGLGFTIQSADPLKDVRPKPPTQTRITNGLMSTSEKLKNNDLPF
jgi:hypothetical protein